jgi:hypothetical protein
VIAERSLGIVAPFPQMEKSIRSKSVAGRAVGAFPQVTMGT